MTKYEEMLNDVLPDVPGCGNDVAINALRNACIELLQKSFIYRQEQDPITVTAGTAVYDLDSFTGYRIVGVTSAYFGDNPIVPVSADMLQKAKRHWETEKGFVEGYMLNDSESVRLYRIPTENGVLSMTLALAPTVKSVGIETFIYDLYSEGIAAGAKARLMAIPGKPYTNLDLSVMNRAMFSSAIRDAKWRAIKSLSSANLTVTK